MCVYRIRDGKTGNLKLFFPLFFFFFSSSSEFVFFKKSSQREREKIVLSKNF